MQQARNVHAAADDLLPCAHLSGNALPGEGAGVQGGATVHHYPVDGNLLSGLYHNDSAHFHIFRIHLLQTAVLPFHIGIIRPDIHKGADVFPALSHRHGLKQFTDLVKKHYRHAFSELSLHALRLIVHSQQHGSHGGHRHQEIFVKNLPVYDPKKRLPQDIVSDYQIGNQIQQEPRIPLHRNKMQAHHQNSRSNDTA